MTVSGRSSSCGHSPIAGRLHGDPPAVHRGCGGAGTDATTRWCAPRPSGRRPGHCHAGCGGGPGRGCCPSRAVGGGGAPNRRRGHPGRAPVDAMGGPPSRGGAEWPLRARRVASHRVGWLPSAGRLRGSHPHPSCGGAGSPASVDPSGSGPLFPPAQGADGGGLDDRPGPVERIGGLQLREPHAMEPRPDPGALSGMQPAPAGHAGPTTSLDREGLPRDAGLEHEEHPRQDLPVVQGLAARSPSPPALGRWQQRCETAPQPVVHEDLRHAGLLSLGRFRQRLTWRRAGYPGLFVRGSKYTYTQMPTSTQHTEDQGTRESVCSRWPSRGSKKEEAAEALKNSSGGGDEILGMASAFALVAGREYPGPPLTRMCKTAE